MSLPTSTLAYSQCYEVLDLALKDSLGIRMRVDRKPSPQENLDAAMNFRMRCHQARKLDRDRNAEVYPDPEHPLHGRSAYDVLIIRDPKVTHDGDVYLVIERCDLAIDGSVIESLSEAPPVEFKPIERVAAPPKQLMIEGPRVLVRRR